MSRQINVRAADAVHERLERVAAALDAKEPVGTEPMGRTGAARVALLRGLAMLEAELGLATKPPRTTGRRNKGTA
jgi:hypothetical protein